MPCQPPTHQRLHACFNRKCAYGQLAADAGVDAGVSHEALLACQVEERPVRHSRLVCARTGIRWPGVEVRVEVDDRDGPVDFVQRTEDRQDDGVVSTQTEK